MKDNFYKEKFDDIHAKAISEYKKLYGVPSDQDLSPVLSRMAHTHACEQMRTFRKFMSFVFDSAVFGFDEAVEKVKEVATAQQP